MINILVVEDEKPISDLIDEPTGAVDSKTSDLIFELFKKLNQELGLTIIIVTHDTSLASKVPRVLMIADGKVSTEKVIRAAYANNDSVAHFTLDESVHTEYSVLDKANRVQLPEEVLKNAGISSKKVKIEVNNGKIVISGEE